MVNIEQRSRVKKIIILLAAVVAVICGFFIYKHYYKQQLGTGIFDYDPKRDRASLIKLFGKYRYWLYGDNVEFAPEFTLDNRASSKKPSDKGNLIIKVQLEDNKPVGLIAYFLQKLYEAQILYLVVDENYRKRGYAKKLMLYALDDLKKRGQRLAWLITRMGNEPARKLYESLGFKEFWSNDKYIKYKKYLD